MSTPTDSAGKTISLEDLRQRLETHRFHQILYGVALAVGALFAWMITFVAVFVPFSFALRLFGFPVWLAILPAMLAVLLEAAYGVWKAVELLKHNDDQFVHYLTDTSLTEAPWNSYSLDYAIGKTILLDIVTCAPKASVMAIRTFRTLTLADEATIQQAHKIRQHLLDMRDEQRWLPLQEFADSPRALILLHQLKLISVDERDGLVRLSS